MVLLWSTLATRDVRLARGRADTDAAAPRSTAWVTYLRCHDDIGWAVSDEDARAVGLDPPRTARSSATSTPVSTPARSPAARCSRPTRAPATAASPGSAASLCGLEAALAAGDAVRPTSAVARLLMLYSVVYSYGGIPLLYMGDEVALRNDPSGPTTRRTRATTGGCTGRRWTGPRPTGAPIRHRRGPVFTGLAEMARVRAGCSSHCAPATGPSCSTPATRGCSAYVRRHPRGGRLVALAAFCDDRCGAAPARPAGLRGSRTHRARRPRRRPRRPRGAPARLGLRLDRRRLGADWPESRRVGGRRPRLRSGGTACRAPGQVAAQQAV